LPVTVLNPTPHITSVGPSSKGPATTETISGTAFGASQGSGVISISGTIAAVNTWSDTAVSAVVPASAVTGVVKVQQNGKWSNGTALRVPISGTPSMTLTPHVVSMLVGDARSLQALAALGAAV
jgi:hypothetical protein